MFFGLQTLPWKQTCFSWRLRAFLAPFNCSSLRVACGSYSISQCWGSYSKPCKPHWNMKLPFHDVEFDYSLGVSAIMVQLPKPDHHGSQYLNWTEACSSSIITVFWSVYHLMGTNFSTVPSPPTHGVPACLIQACFVDQKSCWSKSPSLCDRSIFFPPWDMFILKNPTQVPP